MLYNSNNFLYYLQFKKKKKRLNNFLLINLLIIPYLIEGILPQKHSERYKLKRLAIRYFLHNTVLFKKGYDGDPLRCLGPEEAKWMIKEMHLGECREH